MNRRFKTTSPIESLKFDSPSHRQIEHYLQEFLRTDLAEDPAYRDRILLAGLSIRSNLLDKWENAGNSFHLTLNPPTATLCVLEGNTPGRMETLGLRQFLELTMDAAPATPSSTTRVFSERGVV